MGVQPTRKGKGKGKQVERQGARHSREQKPDEGATMQDWLSLFRLPDHQASHLLLQPRDPLC